MSSIRVGHGVKSMLCAVAFFGAAMTVSAAFAAEEAGPKLNVGGVEGPGGSIKGVIKFTGDKPKRSKPDVSGDKFCAEAHTGEKALLTELFVPGDGDTLQNVLVTVVGKGLSNKPGIYAKPELDQVGCQYVPHVQAIVAGQELLILNNDSTLHNVKIDSKNNGAFNEGMPVKGMKLTKKFAKPDAIQFKCDVHPWMTSYVHVVEHPFFAVTQQDGSFEIKGLPAGEYDVKVWHENTKRLKADKESQKVTVADGKAAEANFTYTGVAAAPK